MQHSTAWTLLHQLRSFAIRIETRTRDGLSLAHAGSGELQVCEVGAPDSGTVIWRETGRWTTGPLAGIRFRNATAWRPLPDGGGIELSHLRRGDDRPTLLARLTPGPGRTWVAAEPHVCGPDRYFASLEWIEDGLRLVWEVESPTDPYRLTLEARRG